MNKFNIPKGWRRIRLGERIPINHKFFTFDGWRTNESNRAVLTSIFPDMRMNIRFNNIPHIIEK